ncbi:MAG: hypothetical protein FJ315_08965 [SAR202 cluster bacterium]|nr:hypothetical protein [SAR202 cluster bacterium]
MTREEIAHLRAEIGVLRRQLDAIPARARMTRRSTEARLRDLEALVNTEHGKRPPARVRLSFRGRPVVGAHGIFAAFAAGAIERFSRAVALLAAGQGGQIAARGPIPYRESNELLVVGPTVGSFGFELEEYQPSGAAPDLGFDLPTPVAVALEQLQALLAGAAGTDDDLAEAASGIDPRARGALQEFLSHVAGQGAVCAVETGGRAVHFAEVAQVTRAAARLAEDSVRQTEQVLAGSFQGVLPMRRTFEFRETGSEEILGGKLGPAALDPNELNDHLREETTIRVTATQVGSGKARYTLNEMPVFGPPDQTPGDRLARNRSE